MQSPHEKSTSSDAVLQDYLAAVRARRNAFGLTSLGILAALLLFAWSSYASLRDNFAREKLIDNGQRVGAALVAEAQPQLIAAAKDLVPVYRAEAERALEGTLPQLQQRALRELELLQEHLSAKSQASIQRAVGAPVESVLNELMGQFPALRDEAYVAELLAQSEAMVTHEMLAVVEETHALYEPQLQRVANAIGALRSEQLAAMNTDELMQRFMHLWIILIDTELMGGAPCDVDALSLFATDDDERGG